MITKFPRYNEEGRYNLRITDFNGNSFTMMVGGNGDLYWVPENHKINKVFEIDSGDEFAYRVFEQLYDKIVEVDNKYNPVIKNDVINFISEDYHEDEANVLNISKTKDKITIEFIRNENKNAWSVPHIGCNICFCNSGSRVPKIEQLFMLMFNKLAYYCDLIPLEEEYSI